MNEKEIFSTKITKGNRTYFFDIKKTEQRYRYLKISESKKTENGFEVCANLELYHFGGTAGQQLTWVLG